MERWVAHGAGLEVPKRRQPQTCVPAGNDKGVGTEGSATSSASRLPEFRPVSGILLVVFLLKKALIRVTPLKYGILTRRCHRYDPFLYIKYCTL